MANYEYYSWKHIPAAIVEQHVIKTSLSNIKSETVLRPLNKTSHVGINGGFFEATQGYSSPPTGGASIIYVKGEENQTVTYEGRTLKKNYLSNTSVSGNEISRKTAVFYKDMNGSLRATHLYVKNLNEVYAYYPKSTVEMVIGGNDYNLENWGGSSIKGELGYYLSIPRTILAWKNNDAYLIAGQGSVPFMRDIMDDLGLNAVNSIMLDGSGSTQMQINNPKRNPVNSSRYVYNMIRVITP
ncbi:hypothetical protein ASD24_27330 [Paenibacillus sp. Root52]|uniref:Phosphodiester glycosidase domain-containing protein n=1 Tax=Paenibacillus amylolyticus TaxID=1451 RepID=A0AAP5HAC8_PAEAM|nr:MULTISPECIES: phosphodiester glycosidase family protein [Paenibacillus]KQY86758.1 hypothetical protein ASD24_27330 [Paenibacillus sp. Root52]MDR6726871.1 hypothetical protein [Paenibacillus amylolyticus]